MKQKYLKTNINKLKNINKFIDLINNDQKKYINEIANKTYPNFKIFMS